MTFQEAKKVKAVEGIPPDAEAVLKDIERGVELKEERKAEKKGVKEEKKSAKLAKKNRPAEE